MNTHIKKVALNFHKQSVNKRFQEARAYVKEMSGNPNFTSPSPALNLIIIAANDVETAFIAAQNRTRGFTKVMHEKDEALKALLRKLAAYVEGIANATPAQAESIIMGAGMQVKKTTIHKPRMLAVVSLVKGQVILTTVTERDSTYRWEVATSDPQVDANWKLLTEVRQSKVTMNGLTSGTNYYFRVWPIGKAGRGQVSQIVSTVVL